MADNDPSINSLPTEILSDIFTFIQPEGVFITEPTDKNFTPENRKYPWVLSLVCRRWRDIIFAAPYLWGNITVHLGAGPRWLAVYGSMLATFELCLERSKEHPLNLSVLSHGREAFILPCFRRASHWRNVTVDFPIYRLLPILTNPDFRCPHLRSLRLLEHKPGIGLTPALSTTELFTDAPLLSKLHLKYHCYRPTAIRFPWPQITDFAIDTQIGNVNGLLSILREMPNLISLQFHQPTQWEESTHAIPPLELSHLRKLSWAGSMGIDTYSALFNSVRAPRLTVIEIKGHPSTDAWIGTVEQFLRESGCTITSAKLEAIYADVMSSLLTILPDLETINLSLANFNKRLLQTLTFDDSKSQWPCPRIKRIILNMPSVPKDMWADFAVMLESRLRVCENPQACALASVYVLKPTYGLRWAWRDQLFMAPFEYFGERYPQYKKSITIGDRYNGIHDL